MLIADDGRTATAIETLAPQQLPAWLERRDATTRAWVAAAGFRAAANETVRIPDADGGPGTVLAGLGEHAALDSLGALPMALPEGDYRLAGADGESENGLDRETAARLALGWGLGGYQFTDYKSPKRAPARLLLPPELHPVRDEADAVALCRDIVNTPTEDMLPHHLEAAARKLAAEHDAAFESTVGDALTRHGFHAIHAVGRASASPPRLIDLRWGDAAAPKITLVGKGVCFDSGGLDLKPAAGMRLMKKDLGGAAHVLGLAKLIMARRLPVRLRVLVPAVENAVSANAYRPGDVLRTYRGLTVEVGNTDAEGRLILADALALAADEKPAALIDFATLTGAARTALGTELPALFSNSDDIARGIAKAADAAQDPVWRMPLHAPYRRLLDSDIADLSNIPSVPYAGAIAAALFLERFVDGVPWAHFDVMAWNLATRPAHPVGGEAMGLRAVYGYIAGRV